VVVLPILAKGEAQPPPNGQRKKNIIENNK